MSARTFTLILAIMLVASSATSETPETRPLSAPTWRPPGSVSAAGGNAAPAAPANSPGPSADDAARGALRTASLPPRAPLTAVGKGTGTLPNDQGQVWR